MRLLDIYKTASLNMASNKRRTFLTIFAIFIAAFTLTITSSLGVGITSYLDKQVNSFGAENALIITNMPKNPGDGPSEYEEGSQNLLGVQIAPLVQDDIETIEGIDGVDKVYTYNRYPIEYIVNSDGGKKYSLEGNIFLKGQKLDLVAGSEPDSKDEPQIALTPDYVKALGYGNAEDAVGKKINLAVNSPAKEIKVVQSTISGVYNESLLAFGLQYYNDLTYEKIQSIATENLPDKIKNSYVVAIAYADNAEEATLNSIKSDAEDNNLFAQTIADRIGVIATIINAIVIILSGFALIALIAAGFGVINTLFMSVQERTKEIGLMKAVGLSSAKVFALFSFEAIMIGVWGSIVGILASIGLGAFINNVAEDGFLKDLPGLTLIEFSPMNIGFVILLIILITFLAGTLPALRAAKLNPIDALRYE